MQKSEKLSSVSSPVAFLLMLLVLLAACTACSREDGLTERRRKLKNAARLSEAIERWQHVALRRLLHQGYDIIGKSNRMGNTPLMVAAARGDRELFFELVDDGADIEAENQFGRTMLMMGARGGDTAILAFLLKKGLDVSARSQYGITALMEASTDDAGLLLVENGASHLARDHENTTVLMYAASAGLEKTVKKLVAQGADVTCRNDHGESALVYTAAETVFCFLLEKGAPVQAANRHEDSALELAARHGFHRGVQMLLDRNAPLNARDKDQETPLHWAVAHNQVAIAEGLVSKGAAVNPANEEKQTPLMWAHSPAMLQLLLRNGAEHSRKDSMGKTALMWYTEQGYTKMARMLLDAGAGLNVKSLYGRTALMMAAQFNRQRLAELFLARGAAINAVSGWGMTALMWAAKKGHGAMVSLLLQHGANTDIMNYDADALVHAIEHNNRQAAGLLLEGGADPYVRDRRNGQSVLQWARDNAPRIYKRLRNSGVSNMPPPTSDTSDTTDASDTTDTEEKKHDVQT